MKISILYINNTDPSNSGGGNQRIFEEGKELARQGHNVKLLTGKTAPNLPRVRKVNGLTIQTVKCVPDCLHSLPVVYFYLTRSLFPFISFPILLWKLLVEDIDLVVDSYTPHPSLAVAITLFASTPVVAVVHEYHDQTAIKKYPVVVGVIQLVVQNFLRSGIYSAIIVPSKITRKALHDYGVKPPVHVVPNGIHYENYANCPESIDVKSYEVLFVSRLVYRKGIDHGLRAMAEVHRKRPEASFGIVGDGPDKESFKNLAKELEIDGSVDFLGFVSEERKIALLHNAEVFALPSRQEGFGIAALEAMATGTPVVVNDLAILRELVPDDGGAFVDVRDKDEFSEAVLDLLENDRRRKRGLLVNQERSRNYSWQRVGCEAAMTYLDCVTNLEA